jgi:sugar-specific transcriptional regulator TrmB
LIREEQIRTLTKLGLSVVQAKTYLNLAKLGEADVKSIAAASSVARQDIYRIMVQLQKAGLAEKIIAEKVIYKATPIKDGLELLLDNQKREYAETQKEIKSCFKNFYEKSQDTNDSGENIQFSVTYEKVRLLKNHEKLANLTKNSLKMVIPLKLNTEQLLKKFDYVPNAVNRHVEVRVIVQDAGEEKMSSQKMQDSYFELRYMPETAITCGMHVFDDHELTIAVIKDKPVPSLWTNSPHLVELANVYFDSLWNKAKKAVNPSTLCRQHFSQTQKFHSTRESRQLSPQA